MTSLHRDNRIVRPMLLVEADLMHINMYSFLHNIGPISFYGRQPSCKFKGNPRLSQLKDSI